MCTELSPQVGAGTEPPPAPGPDPALSQGPPPPSRRPAARIREVPAHRSATYPGTPASRCRSPGRSSAGRRRRGWPGRTRAGSACSGTARSPERARVRCHPRLPPAWAPGDGLPLHSPPTPGQLGPGPRAHPLSAADPRLGQGTTRGHRQWALHCPPRSLHGVGPGPGEAGAGGSHSPARTRPRGTTVVPGPEGACTRVQLMPIWKEAAPLTTTQQGLCREPSLTGCPEYRPPAQEARALSLVRTHEGLDPHPEPRAAWASPLPLLYLPCY